jgi:nucleoside 2-deoxyribosyltransferase
MGDQGEKPAHKAFVIMPFDPEFNALFAEVIRPALEDAEYEVLRADSLLDQQNIIRDIVQGIATADLVVADLTTLNSNVLYELGLAHGLNVPTVLITQSLDEVPFDLRSYRIQVYSTNFAQVTKLTDGLRDIAEKHSRGDISFGNPVTDFAEPREGRMPPVGVKGRSPQERKPIGDEAAEPDQDEEEEEGGFLDFLVEGREASDALADVLTHITEETQSIGSKFQQHNERIQRLAASPHPGSASQARALSLAAAKDLTTYSERVAADIPRLNENIDRLLQSAEGFATWIAPRAEEARDTVIAHLSNLQSLANASKQSLVGTRSFRDSVRSLHGISRELNQASRHAISTLDQIISAIERIEPSSARTIQLLDEALNN